MSNSRDNGKRASLASWLPRLLCRACWPPAARTPRLRRCRRLPPPQYAGGHVPTAYGVETPTARRPRHRQL